MDNFVFSALVHNSILKTGSNAEVNGQKSKKIAKASKNKSLSSAAVGHAFHTSHIEPSVTKNSKDGTRRSASHVSKNEATKGVDNTRKTKKVLKDKIHDGPTDDLLKDVKGPGRELQKDALKKSQISTKNDVSNKGGNEEVQKAKLSLKTKNSLVSKGQTNGSGYVSGDLGDEDVAQPTKRRRLALEGMPEDRTTESSSTPIKGGNSDSVKSGHQVHTKRRAVRIFDEDEDEPKTPVHGKPSKVVDKVSHTSISVEEAAVVTEAVLGSPGVRESVHVKEPVSRPQHDILEVVEGKLHTPQKSSEEILKVFVSPVKSPFDAHTQMIESSKVKKTSGKVSGTISQKKGPSSVAYGDGQSSQTSEVNQRSKPVISAEKQKSTAKSSSRITDSAAVLRKPSDSNFLCGERCVRIHLNHCSFENCVHANFFWGSCYTLSDTGQNFKFFKQLHCLIQEKQIQASQ